MIKRLIDRVFRKEMLDGCGAVDSYLHRWCLLSLPNGRRLYLHHFIGDDFAEHMHDHPKAFLSIGLWGSYIEERPRGFHYSADNPGLPGAPGGDGSVPIPEQGVISTVYRAPWIRKFPPQHIHRVLVPKRAWTLVYTGPSQRPWGFWVGREWIPWRRYISAFGGDDC